MEKRKMKGNGYFWVIMVGVMVSMSAASVCVNSGGSNCSVHNVEIMPVETRSTYAQRETDMYFQMIPQSLDEKRQMGLDADIQITSDELDEQHPSIAIDADGNPIVLYDRKADFFQHDIYIQFSPDGGSSWPSEDTYHLVGDEDLSAEYPDIEMMDSGTRAVATFQNKQFEPILYFIDMADITSPETWGVFSFDLSGSSNYCEGTAVLTYEDTTFAIAHTRDYTSGEYDLDSTVMIYWTTDINAVTEGSETVQGVFWTTDDLFYANPDATSGNGKLYMVCEQDTGDQIKLFIASAPADLEDYSDWQGNTISSREADLKHPKIAVSGNNHYIVAELESNGNKDIVCYTSKTGSMFWTKNVVSDYPFDQEMYPSITASGEKAICSFIQSGDIYFSTTEDSGTTWSNPIKINDQEDAVVQIRNSAELQGPYIVWSDNRNANNNLYFDIIPAPIISIDAISGGLGITATISNTGTAVATNVPWSISLDGGLIFAGNDTEGTIASLAPETSVTVTSDFIFGIGRVNIAVTTGDKQLAAEGFMLGPLIFGI